MNYTRKSPLMPQEGGYPIILGQGIEAEDLETEYIPLRKGSRMVLVPVKNIYLMKGATNHIRAKNANSDAEIDEIAEQIAGHD